MYDYISYLVFGKKSNILYLSTSTLPTGQNNFIFYKDVRRGKETTVLPEHPYDLPTHICLSTFQSSKLNITHSALSYHPRNGEQVPPSVSHMNHPLASPLHQLTKPRSTELSASFSVCTATSTQEPALVNVFITHLDYSTKRTHKCISRPT